MGLRSVRRDTASAADLLTNAARGDQRAWDELVERFAQMVWDVARSHDLSETEAADACELTWLALADHLNRIDASAGVEIWLATTARCKSRRALSLTGRQVSPTLSGETPIEEP